MWKGKPIGQGGQIGEMGYLELALLLFLRFETLVSPIALPQDGGETWEVLTTPPRSCSGRQPQGGTDGSPPVACRPPRARTGMFSLLISAAALAAAVRVIYKRSCKGQWPGLLSLGRLAGAIERLLQAIDRVL